MAQLPIYNREGCEFTKNEFKKVMKRLSDAYRKSMEEQGLKINISWELARVHPHLSLGLNVGYTSKDWEELEAEQRK